MGIVSQQRFALRSEQAASALVDKSHADAQIPPAQPTSKSRLITAAGFVSGTLLITQSGQQPIETLKSGDNVLSRDGGFQPILWIGGSACLCRGDNAPVKIEAGVFGNHERLVVAPNTRILFKSAQAAVLFGETEVLICAKDLVNGTSITRLSDNQPVSYVHVLFERHEIIQSNGLDTESYHPNRETMQSFAPHIQSEIQQLLPNSDAFMGFGYGPLARASLRANEAKALLSTL